MVTLSLSNVAGVFGNVFAFALISAPIKTMLQIKRDNGVGNRWVLNYVATYVNAVCVVAYTLPEKRYLVAVINAVAVVTELLYSCFYRRYAQGRARTVATWAIVGELAWGLVVFVGYFGGFYGGRNEDLRVHLFGTLAAFTSAAMYVAMIPDTWAVYTTRNVENQNILLLLAGVGNCTSWMLHAIKPQDYYIEVPNGMGLGFTVLQTLVWVTIWFKFRNAAPAQQQQQQQQQNDSAQNQQQQQQNDPAQNQQQQQQQQINPAQNQHNVELQPVAV